LRAADKARIVAEHDALDELGRGALLRREGLYGADVDRWRRGAGPPAPETAPDAPCPEPDPAGPAPERGRRLRTPAEKLALLKEYDAAPDAAARAELALREGLSLSNIPGWRRARDKGALEALSDRRFGPKGLDRDKARIAELESQNRRLRDELDTARQVVRVQGKLVALLEQLPADSATPPSGSKPVRRSSTPPTRSPR
jgi:transposase-like protein